MNTSPGKCEHKVNDVSEDDHRVVQSLTAHVH